MDRAEARNRLRWLKVTAPTTMDREALDLAIEALGEQSVSEKERVADRARIKLGDKVTIPAVVEEIEYTTLGEISYKVKPITTWFDADEIEEWKELGKATQGNAETATTTDCISRKQAVEALTGWDTEPLDEDIVRTLNNLPPAPPTERTGEWLVYPLLDKGRVELACSECGDTFIRAVGYKPYFCENCGAKMGGDSE